MKESNSDWLDDTVSEEENITSVEQNNNSDNNEENTNNIINEEEDNISNPIIEKENDQKKDLTTQTLSGMVDKIEEEELSEEEKYLNAYIGPNAEKFSYKIFSFPGLLFSSLYVFYRKMYLLGFISLVIQLALALFVNPYVALVINIIIFLFFNSLYTSHAKRKIEKTIHSSGSKETGYIINVCSEKGGVNKGVALFIFILEIAIIILSFIFLPVSKFYDGIKEQINEYSSEIDIELPID